MEERPTALSPTTPTLLPLLHRMEERAGPSPRRSGFVRAGGERRQPLNRESRIANRNSQIAAGRPYFVMELVQGVPITEFCDKNKLSVEERIELVIPVCQAIQHAHQKGIIHRDLKP